MATREFFNTVLVLYSITVSLALSQNDTTYLRELPSGRTVSCDLCPPGSHLLKHCTETQRTVCQPCNVGFYTEYWNYIYDCLPCAWCSQDQVETQECTKSSDRVCGCKEGFYMGTHTCMPHTVCPKGYEVKEKGTAEKDTVCESCRGGYYASGPAGDARCVPHTECKSGAKLLFNGNSYVDNVCVTCNEITCDHDWVRCINQPLIEVFKNHTSRKLLRFIRSLTNSANSCIDGLVTVCADAHFQKLQQWFNKTSVQDVAKLPELLQERGMKNLAAKIQHRMNKIQDEVNLCKNTLTA